METEQLKSIEFELSWEIRDEIISTISQHTKLLSGLIIDAYARERMRKANGDLVIKLMNLPLKVDGRLRSFESFGRLGGALNEVVLDLNQETRSRVVDMLMSNHQIALETGSVLSECKSQQINQNNHLITELLQLKSRVLPIIKPSFGLNASQPLQPAQTLIEKTNSPLNSDSNKSQYNGLADVRCTNQDPSASWHSQVSDELRSQQVQKIIASILPGPEASVFQDKRINLLINYGQKIELDFYKAAKSTEEYYELIAEKIVKIQKELEEKGEARKRMKEQEANQQQQSNSIRSETYSSTPTIPIKEEPGTAKAVVPNS